MSNNSLTFEQTQLEKLISRQGELETLFSSLTTDSTDVDEIFLVADQRAQTEQRLKLICEAIEKQREKVNELEMAEKQEARRQAKKSELTELTSNSKLLDKQRKKAVTALQAYVKALDELYSIKPFSHKSIVGQQWLEACEAVGASHEVIRLMSWVGRDNPNELKMEFQTRGSTLESVTFEKEIKLLQQELSYE